MKKLNYILFSLLAVLFATSCEDPKEVNPVLNTPTEFVLNTPVMQNQYIELTPETCVKLTASQPNYGYAAAADYYVQVSLTEDFADFAEVNEEPYHNLGNIEVNGDELAMAICKLRGIAAKEDYTDEPARTIYLRLRAEVKAMAEQSAIISNVVSLTQVKEYFALKLPGYIYLIGACGGWTGPDAGAAETLASWRLFEADDAIGSKIYSGTFEVAAGQATFRFYRKLQGWDALDENGVIYSIGLKEADEATDVAFTDGIFSSAIVDGKGSLNFPGWEGGKMKMTVDLNSYKVTVQVVE